MKTKFKLIAIKSLICLSATTLFFSCNDDKFFELPDHGGIDAAIWDAEGSVQLHLNRAYDVIIPQFVFNLSVNWDRYGIHYASDENFFPNQEQWARRALGIDVGYGTLQNNDVRYVGNRYDPNVGSNRYFDIARCNNAIKFIPLGSLPKEKKDVFLGQYYALRAMVYFELAKVYGGVPLILEPVDPQNMPVSGRNSAREIFESVLSDLDSAISKLGDKKWDDIDGRGKINRLIATCLKAKVLMYWASPQFNPLNDAARWQTAFDANKEAYDLSLAEGRSLVPDYANIFRLEGTKNPEAILVRTYSNSIERRGHNVENSVRPGSVNGSAHQGFVATKRLLDAYPMKDGNPIDYPGGAYSYDDVIFWVNRDPRFEATIAYNGSSWPLNGDDNRRQWNYTGAVGETNLRGVYCKRFSTPGLTQANAIYANGIGGSGMDWIELRLAEVMLNYAECANEIGNITLAKDMVRQIRVRAGIEAGSNDYGLGVANDVVQMRDLIMNERMIEFAFENKRHSDLRRTRRMHELTGNMQTVAFGVVGANANEQKATREEILEVIDPNTGLLFRETLDIDDKDTYLTYFKPYTLSTPNWGPYSVPEYHYFYTFHNDFVNKGANIEPTIGWAGGTFDPLED